MERDGELRSTKAPRLLLCARLFFLPESCIVTLGFSAQIWDQMFGSMYTGEQVISAMEARKRGLRTEAAWAKIEKPDYSVLLTKDFWLRGSSAAAAPAKSAAGKAGKAA